MAPVGKQLFSADTGGELWGDGGPHILGHLSASIYMPRI